ncbi:hypothetical protein AB4Z51_43555 [Bradyrhizobium sp. 2TAF36]
MAALGFAVREISIWMGRPDPESVQAIGEIITDLAVGAARAFPEETETH